jgi:CHAT domain-containing protein/tetratricopeptide (TPR) repeat protein
MIQALDIREKALGSMHPDVAKSAHNLALLYQMQGAYAKAEPLLVRALNIQENALGAMHPNVAKELNNLALLYKAQGLYEKAREMCLRALDINEKALGREHPDVASNLNNLAQLYQIQGAYEAAESLYVRSLDITEKALGTKHPDLAKTLNNLALLYKTKGAYGKAERLYLRALEIDEKALGAKHPDVATSLHNLAGLYLMQGEYGKAEPLYVRVLEIREKILGSMHPDLAGSLADLALVYYAQGAYEKAEPLMVHTLEIREKALGSKHPDVASSLNSLAALYYAQGAYEKAEPLYMRALGIEETALGPKHPDVARSLNNLAELYRAQGAYEKAEPLIVRALGIREKALGGTHPEVASSLDSLAMLYQTHGAYRKAESLMVRALGIAEKAQGAIHPDVAKILNDFAMIYWVEGAYGKAEPLVARAADIQEDQLRHELARLSAPRKRALMLRLQGQTDSVVSLHIGSMPASARALELALTTILRRKGRVLDSLAENQASLLAHLSPALRDTFRQLTDANSELSSRLWAPFDPREAANRTGVIAALRGRIEALEATLNAASAEFRAQSELVTVAKVQAALPAGAALVEFVRYDRFDARKAQHWQEARYAAYVLPWQGPPQWVALGEAAPIDVGIDAVLAAIHKDASGDAAKAALQHLDALVFAPVRKQLTGVSHVILSPDGKLNLVPFEALVGPQGRYALENWLISYVGSGRDLLRLAARRAPRSPATIVAAPDYGPLSSGTNGLGRFHPLGGALAEAKELRAYLPQARTWTGKQATKAALAAMVGPSMLHIATHGFFARDAATGAARSGSATASTARSAPPRPFTPPDDWERGMDIAFSSFVPPLPTSDALNEALDRAGLALAGANVRPEGIVTARELASYDWWGTKLVVLSACDTGLGAVASGEGVYGMRRALVLAGAESQVVSLWSVDDVSTRELMREFYGELARGTERAEALRRAKLRLMREPRYAHPYYWAAFIPAGDWRPLDPQVFKRSAYP